MTRPVKGAHRPVYLDVPTFDLLDGIAGAQDVNTGALIRAALAGLARSGQVERFVSAGAAADADVARLLSKRRARPERWTVDTTGGAHAGVWTRGPWSVRYVGNPKRAKVRTPGEGWHLYGPGIEVGMFLDYVGQEARDRADGYIARYEAHQAARAVVPDPTPGTATAPSGDPWEAQGGSEAVCESLRAGEPS